MRGILSDYTVEIAVDLSDALQCLSDTNSGRRVLAGGTDLMVLLAAGKLGYKRLLDVSRLSELKNIELSGDSITLGALVTYAELQQHPVLQKEFPNLIAAARETGAIAIQNRGTLGGNLVNASPAADSPPALLVYEASCELVSAKRGARWIPLREFFKGYKVLAMEADELLTRVRLPRTTQTVRHFYRKVGTRKAQAISKVCIAGTAVFDEKTGSTEVRIAYGAVAPTTIRAHHVESLLNQSPWSNIDQDSLFKALGLDIYSINDIRSIKDYRERVAQNVLLECLESLHVGLAR